MCIVGKFELICKEIVFIRLRVGIAGLRQQACRLNSKVCAELIIQYS